MLLVRDVALVNSIFSLINICRVKPQQQGDMGIHFSTSGMAALYISTYVCVCVISVFIFFTGNGWRSIANVNILFVRLLGIVILSTWGPVY